MPDIFQDSSRYFHLSAFYALSLPYYHMEHHTHSSYEIMYITSGSCRVFCLDGTQDTEFPLKSGQFIFIRPDVPHRLEIPDGFPCSILNLEFSLTSEESPVPLELLLKKDPGFSRFWNFMEASQGFCSGADSRSFGYSLKDLLTFLQQNSGQIQKEEFLFFLLFSRMLTELAFCARSSRSTQGIVYLKKALRYKNYWGEKGGITVSGGEPLLQIDFLIELFRKAKKNGVHTTLDTSGNPFTREEPYFSKFNELMKYTDLLLLDIKLIDDKAHRELTGCTNENILDLARYLDEIGKPVWIRHVLVPERSDYDEYLIRLDEFLHSLHNVQRVEVLPYHTLGVFKWETLGIPYKLEGINPPTKERVENANKLLHTAEYTGYLK